MISKFVREETHYSKDELMSIFECNPHQLVSVLEDLKKHGILKIINVSDKEKDLSELISENLDEIEIEVENSEYNYVFKFVGVIAIRNYILKCYPKYIGGDNPVEELKVIIKVLEKYNSNQQFIQTFSELETSISLNYLPLLMFILNDYYEYGIYTNINDTFEVNGDGGIDWNKTINETYPIIAESRPYYTTLFTKRKTVDESDYFKRLHECIITKFSRDLENAGLVELFDFTPIYLSDEELDDFGDKEYILYRLEKEINIQYITHKQLLLKAIYAYIKNENTISKLDGFSFFGTKTFNLVWEKVCSEVLDNHLKRPLGTFTLPHALHESYNQEDTLMSIIEKPIWTGYTVERERFEKEASRTLTPDVVNIRSDKMIIYDAKYYSITLEEDKRLSGQPGVSDVTKQYLYQLAFKDFLEKHSIKYMQNYFLFPSENEFLEDKGFVNMNMFSDMGLPSIKIKMLPAKKLYEYYLNDAEISLYELEDVN